MHRLEEHPSSTTFELHEVFYLQTLDGKVGQLKGTWPRSDDITKYKTKHYENPQPVNDDKVLTAEEQKQIYGNIPLDIPLGVSRKEIFIVFKENIARCIVLEEHPGSTTFKLHQLFHVWELDRKVGQLKGKWPHLDDIVNYKMKYYENPQPLNNKKHLTAEEQEQTYENIPLDILLDCIPLNLDQSLNSCLGLERDNSARPEIFIVFKENIVPTVREDDPSTFRYSREQIAAAARRRDSPSMEAQVKALLNTQVKGRPDAMYNHRPLSLIFTKFLSLVTTPIENIDFSHEELDHALNFLTDSANYYPTETARSINLRGIADAVHPNILNQWSIKPEGSVSFPCPLLDGLPATAAITELQNELGEGDWDPIAHAECAYIAIISSTRYTPLREATCCPAFLVGIDGPNLTVSGAVFADSFMSERLIAYEFIGPRPNVAGRSRLGEGIMRAAQIFRTLRLCLEDLRLFYAALSPSPSSSTLTLITQRLEYSVEYIDRIVPNHPDKALFRAHITAKGNAHSETAVVKFTHRYCTHAHHLLASLEPPKAPKLFFSDVVPEIGLHVVVMAYVPYVREIMVEADVEEIRVAVTTLHENGLVLGDLRWPNVLLLPEGGVNLVDFDWCGEEGTVVYPADIYLDDELGDRHEETQRHGCITKEHDAYMFRYLTGSDLC
ncbi:hypothetical protein BDP27DRAFT_1335927 [Rhodocollybia butyracea]|uniref:Protein kinase domain-containing protein n=1 Tax=Rhodocollybia butyracea TaxID=206335 RepID=A0A9P5PHW3_9AGAR|nr:hypothetical protein BDP27DRAFT_1335927 [Rhodocollybia butyracea]